MHVCASTVLNQHKQPAYKRLTHKPSKQKCQNPNHMCTSGRRGRRRRRRRPATRRHLHRRSSTSPSCRRRSPYSCSRLQAPQHTRTTRLSRRTPRRGAPPSRRPSCRPLTKPSRRCRPPCCFSRRPRRLLTSDCEPPCHGHGHCNFVQAKYLSQNHSCGLVEFRHRPGSTAKAELHMKVTRA